ncbi:hypothetical protein M8998_04810 [Sphingobacterium sp. lm-10]|uniref:family 2A encapsulin nanocompartment shell protein n=1 Tax=Sphingobacterium sp. lm-10 TaxID=2944904 RepID=UPI002021647F|nr:family 2A encapsulin nanocompartment shell protein [Sphingobacterium sp. lm-10]MCL7987259.1 hypothetical protein [Sphingobacterium sp. lm-10]
MSEQSKQGQTALGDVAARHLAIATRTTGQLESVSPRWVVHLLQWLPVESGVFRLNKVVGEDSIQVDCSRRDESVLPHTFVDYDENPREYNLQAVNTLIDVHTRVSDLYSKPYNQISEQLRLAIEKIKERQESELINNADYGILSNVAAKQIIKTRSGAPTPDDMDELLTKVWKQPGFFLLHPLTIAAFGRECTRRGVPPPTVTLFGSPFLTWRGIPLIPSDKVPIVKGKTKILLIRTGQSRQGVIGLYQPDLPGEQTPGLSIKFTGINDKAIASYLISLYCSLVILVDDAVAVLEDVDITKYHEYNYG